jgi:hypothetical protein
MEEGSPEQNEKILRRVSLALSDLPAPRECARICLHQQFLLDTDYNWILCLNPDSRYCYETLDACFSCPCLEPYQDPDSDESEG